MTTSAVQVRQKCCAFERRQHIPKLRQTVKEDTQQELETIASDIFVIIGGVIPLSFCIANVLDIYDIDLTTEFDYQIRKINLPFQSHS